jgi:predicted aspartyl protease
MIESAKETNECIGIRALWDTGAEKSLIRPEIAKKLNLLPVSMINISTPTDKDKPSNVYIINLYLPNHTVIKGVKVVEGIPGGCDMLIGMDVINLGDFAVTNYNGHTTFSFRMPSMAEIDFVKHSYSIPITNDQKVGSGKKHNHCNGG